MMLRPRWVLALLCALAIAAGFALLGQWQLERALESGEVVHRDTESIRPLGDVARPGGAIPQTATGQLVTVTGRFVPGDEHIVGGRFNDGDEGYWVVSHFITDIESASIPVARGWTDDEVAAKAASRRLAETDSDEPVSVTGRFLPSDAPVVPDEGEDPHSMTTVSVAALVNLWNGYADQPVYSAYIVDAESAAGLAEIHSPPPEQDVSLNWLNVFYALEWVVFAGFAVFLWFRLVRDAVEREKDLAAQGAGGVPRADVAPGSGT
jgi:cytochrome oxidase assembly protein ShyY1